MDNKFPKIKGESFFSNGDDKHFTYGFIYLFIALNILLGTDYKISFPLETPFKALVFMIVIFCISSGVWNLLKINFKNILIYFVYKIDLYSKKKLDNKSSANLAFSGMCVLQLSVYLREGVLATPFFVLGVLVMIWGVMIFFEGSVLIKNLASYISSKIVFGFVSASIVFWATYSSFNQINSIFGVDPSYFPFTITIGIFINVVKVIALASILIMPISLIMVILSLFTSGHGFWSFTRQIFLYSTLILSFLILQFLNFLWSDEFTRQKLIESAQLMDMNNNHLCHNEVLFSEEEKLPVIFISPSSSVVLYNKGDEFDIVECNPLAK